MPKVSTGAKRRAVVLDLDTLHPGDLNLSSLLHARGPDGEEIGWDVHGVTAPSEVASRIQGAQIVVTNKVVLDAAALSQAPQLRCVLVAATGTNNVDLSACFARGIVVCHVRDYGASAVAQHTLALILSLAGSLPQYSEAVRAGRWAQSPFFCLFDYPVVALAGKTLGIVGYGAIGQAVGRMAQALDMQVMVAESLRAGAEPSAAKADAPRHPLKQVLTQADVVTLHCPLTPETHHLINGDTLALMKHSAFLINTGRGDLVAPAALLSALKAGRLAGAGLDVLTQEPPLADDILVNAHLPNLIITPHMAWASQQARQNIINQVAESAQDFLAGRPPARALNPPSQ